MDHIRPDACKCNRYDGIFLRRNGLKCSHGGGPMSKYRRRDFLKLTAGLAASAAGPMIWGKDGHAQGDSAAEKGAKLPRLRWSRFVQGAIDQDMKNLQGVTPKYGIEGRADHEDRE